MARKQEWTTPHQPITAEIAGVTHTGSFQTEKGMIRVSYKWNNKVTQLGSSTPEVLARLILSELVRETPPD